MLIITCNVANAKNDEKIGILYSYQNAKTYKDLNIASFEPYWEAFAETFRKTYLDAQYLCNISSDTMIEDTGVKIILFPLAIDIDQIEVNFLNSFLKNGGKLVVFSGPGIPSQRLQIFLKEHGFVLTKNIISSDSLTLKHRFSDINLELPVGNFYSNFSFDGFGGRVIAKWKETGELGIGGRDNLIYIGYPMGKNINSSSDIQIILSTLDYYFPGIIYSLEKEIDFEEYKTLLNKLLMLRDRAEAAIRAVKDLNYSVPEITLKKYLREGNNDLQKFSSGYLSEDYLKSRQFAYLANNNFSLILSLVIPVRKAEVRAIWLDRETIVKTESPRKLKKLIRNLADAGFNVIFFETVNAGYPIYPSKLLPQNPLTHDWDPLEVAIEEAHNNNIELHAWVWTFAVGNSRHNLIVGNSPQYAGPVISSKGRWWVLAGKEGRLRIKEQPEVWLSPANKKACTFLTELFSEIVQNYDVDGLQLDYVRFPFQNKNEQVGFDYVSKNEFKKKYGYYPSVKNGKYEKWITWKTEQVDSFVKSIGPELKSIKQDLNISAAVFAIPRELRIQNIQQDWEKWAKNKWIDAVYPFYYSYSTDEIEQLLRSAMKDTDGNALIIPGYNLKTLNEGDLSDRIVLSRDIGTLGVALFAAAHLDDDKKAVLVNGPYREKANIIPYNEPGKALAHLFDAFVPLIDKVAYSLNDENDSTAKLQKSVKSTIEGLRTELKYNEAKNLSEIEKKLNVLRGDLVEISNIEKILNKSQQSVYLDRYLNQFFTLVSYLQGSVKSKN